MRNMAGQTDPQSTVVAFCFAQMNLFILMIFFCLKFFLCVCLLMFRARSICNEFSVVVLKPGPGSLLGNVLQALGPGSGIALTQQEHIRCVVVRRLLFDPAI